MRSKCNVDIFARKFDTNIKIQSLSLVDNLSLGLSCVLVVSWVQFFREDEESKNIEDHKKKYLNDHVPFHVLFVIEGDNHPLINAVKSDNHLIIDSKGL